MPIITLDFESYYDTDYSLKKMTNEAYIRDERFHVHGVGAYRDDQPIGYCPDTDDIPEFLRSLELHKYPVLSHHAHFDMAVLNWIFGIRPKFILDTLSMARPLYPTSPLGLEFLAPLLGVGEKGKELSQFTGVRRLTPDQQKIMKGYCLDGDCRLTYLIYLKLVGQLPVAELRVIDQMIREFTEPVFVVNREVAQAEADLEQSKIDAVMLRVGVDDPKELSSNKKFAAVLEMVGVKPPVKISQKTGKETFAFSKKDEDFKRLMEHENPDVRDLVDARLMVKSTIKLTRSSRFVEISKRGPLPSYSLYYGAHTGRPSGGDKLNLKNLPHSSTLRHAIEAPPGHVVVVRDLGQIEARMLGYVAGQEDLMDAFRRGLDPYCHEAGKIYGREIIKDLHKQERTVGKIVVLGCGYGMGWPSLQGQLRVGFMGIPPILFDEAYIDDLNVPVDHYTGQRWFNRVVLESLPDHITLDQHVVHCATTRFLVDSFRAANDKIVELWEECDNCLYDIMDGVERFVGQHELVKTGAHGLTLTPNGMPIHYTNLREVYSEERGKMGRVYDKREGHGTVAAHIYGGRVTENIIQALSYILIKHNKLELAKEFKVAMDVYDEIVCVVPEEQADYCLSRMGEVMAKSPPWVRDLPLKSSGGYAKNYGDCEK